MNRRMFMAAVVASLAPGVWRASVQEGRMVDATPVDFSENAQDFAERVFTLRNHPSAIYADVTIRVSDYADAGAAAEAMIVERGWYPSEEQEQVLGAVTRVEAIRDAAVFFNEAFPAPDDVLGDDSTFFSFTTISGGAAVETNFLVGFVRRDTLLWRLVAANDETWADADLAFEAARVFMRTHGGATPAADNEDGYRTGGLWDLLPLPGDIDGEMSPLRELGPDDEISGSDRPGVMSADAGAA